nr:hypothetical protein [Bradyrhizobium canariense]
MGLPPNVVAAFGRCVGYPDAERPAHVKPRLRQDVVIHHERYSGAADEGGIASYNAALRGFQAGEPARNRLG